MLNFDFKRGGKRCSETDRALQPGETFYSVLMEIGDATERLDYCEEAWQGPPEDCLGWWQAQIPDNEKGKIFWAPKEVLVSFFEHIVQQPEQADVAYITALLLIQKKVLAEQEGIEEPDQKILRVKHRKSKSSYEVPIVDLSPQRVREIQEELGERLFTDAPEDLSDGMEDE